MNDIILNPETCMIPIKDMKEGTIFQIGDNIYMRLNEKNRITDEIIEIACADLKIGELIWILETNEGKVFRGDLCLTTKG